jgi:hypothetical protein
MSNSARGGIRGFPLIYIMVDPMWILLLEAGVALSLLILVVWWTTRPGKKDEDEDSKE